VTDLPQPLVLRHPDQPTLAAAAGARIVLALHRAQAGGPTTRQHVALTGGSMGSAILGAAGATGLVTLVDWSRVHFWWGDERYLPTGHPDRNDTQNRAALLDRLVSEHGLPAANLHAVAGPDLSTDAAASAAAYARQLRAHGSGEWDLVLLGMGPDGHVASLFPHHPAQRVPDAIAVAVSDSPKPPATRVSLTFACLTRARRVWFLVAGADKSAAVCRALTPGADPWDVPAAGVRGRGETLWLVDEPAAASLPEGWATG
jgi:6-phosphogluconolactonase